MYQEHDDEQMKTFTDKIDLEAITESVVMENKRTSVEAKIDDVDVQINLAKDFQYTILWTEKDKRFVCIEHWTRKSLEITIQDELIMVETKESVDTWISIQVEIGR